ncbi:MAG TPA: glycosyltransferase [Actinomycetota bacterium]|nr:glycosyltransferase [Actinomycetota bacterium]
MSGDVTGGSFDPDRTYAAVRMQQGRVQLDADANESESLKVSVVATVKDAGPMIAEFLASLRGQTRPPDEVVIVDGGSTDGTWDRVTREPSVTAVSEPGSNIAQGRNRAVNAATHGVIAVTDADCILDPEWLERILSPIAAGASVVAGFYRPIPGSWFETWAVSHIPDAAEIGPRWLPSSRSLAFRREAFDTAGGYPEWLPIGEDMYLNQRWVQAGVPIERATDAVVYWRPRRGLRATWRQYERYAEGDAAAGMYPERHALRFGAYAALATALWSHRPIPLAAVSTAAVLYASRPLARTWRRSASAPAKAASVAGVPLTMALIDAAKMWGYARGLLTRSRRGR